MAYNHSKAMMGENNPNWNPDKTYLYICETCGREFKSYAKVHRFCSRSCCAKRPDNIVRLKKMAPIVSKLPKKRKRIGLKCICKICGKEFRRLTGKRKYCDEHFYYGTRHKNIKCVICGKLFDRKHPSNKRVTCSKSCLSKLKSFNQKAEKSHRWQGGKTSQEMILRNSKKYKQWRIAVFKRDNFTCMKCGKIGGKLNADHIKPFSLFPELRFDIDNGRTLCINCHRKTKTWGFRAVIYAQKHMETG